MAVKRRHASRRVIQPEGFPSINKSNRLSRSLVFSFTGGQSRTYNSVDQSSNTIVGSLVKTGERGSLVSGFEAIYGTGSTDKITTSLTKDSQKRSWFFKGLLTSFAASRFTDIGDNLSAIGGDSVATILIACTYSGGITALYSLTAPPALNTVFNLHVTWDRTSTNIPRAYLNGVEQSLSNSGTPPVGVYNLQTSAVLLGNRANNLRCLPGYIEQAYIWDDVLTPADVAEHHANPYRLLQPVSRNKTAATGITFSAASNSGYQAASAGYSWSHTCAGTDRYLVVGVSMLSVAQNVTGITYNGVAMTSLGTRSSATGAARIEMWGLAAPATGTNTIAVTLSGSIASAGNASSYNGVHQTSTTEGWAAADATNVGAADAQVNVTTTATGDFIVGVVATDDTAITTALIETGNVTGAGGSGAMAYTIPEAPGTFLIAWTGVGALATWVVGAIALRPVAASGGLSRSQTDALSLTDSASGVKSSTGSQTDAMTLTDTSSASLNVQGSQTDSLALTDSASASLNGQGAQTDALALTDSATGVWAGSASQTDALALTDIQNGIKGAFAAQTDGLALTDGQNAAPGGFTAAQTEALALTDSLTALVSFAVTQIDALALTDIQNAVRNAFAGQTDGLTLDEVLGAVRSAFSAQADAMTLAETQAAQSGTFLIQTDSLSLTDAATGVWVGSASQNDTLALADAMAGLLGISKAQTDALSLADVLAGALPIQYNRSQTDSLALDSIQVSVLGVAFQVNQADALNLIETLSAAAQGGVLMVNPYRVIADLLGVLRLVVDEDPKP